MFLIKSLLWGCFIVLRDCSQTFELFVSTLHQFQENLAIIKHIEAVCEEEQGRLKWPDFMIKDHVEPSSHKTHMAWLMLSIQMIFEY